MNDIFLDSKLKLYYMEDFEKLLQEERNLWKIDNEVLKSVLKNINTNPKVQTLYSNYGGQRLLGSKSYLQFAYTREIEEKLFRSIIPCLLTIYNKDNKSHCYYHYHQPKNNPNYNPKHEKLGLNCRDDDNYFMINRIQIFLKTTDNKIREEFWMDIGEMLKNI